MHIIQINNLLTEEECQKLLAYVKKNTKQQLILKDAEFANAFYEAHKDRFSGLGIDFTGVYDDVTLSLCTKPLERHKDKVINECQYKLLIYLNNLSSGGGTTFFQPNKITSVENKAGRAVIFDINLEHQGDAFPKGEVKYTIGFRLKT